MKNKRFKRTIIRYRISRELVRYFVNEVKERNKRSKWIKDNTITPNIFLFGREYSI